jgi:hypothetical protein
MKEKLKRTFLYSIVSTIVFFSYIVIVLIVPEVASRPLFSILFIYGPLFASLVSLNSIKAHRYVTFKFGLISTLSKWIVFYLGALFELDLTTIILLLSTAFLISFSAEILMFLSIRKADETEIYMRIKADAPNISSDEMLEREMGMRLMTFAIFALVGSNMVLQRTDQTYDVLLHVILWIFMFIMFNKLRRQKLFVKPIRYIIIYMIFTYLAVLLIVLSTEIFDTFFLLLPFSILIFAPIFIIFYKEGLIIQKYHDAQSTSSSTED